VNSTVTMLLAISALYIVVIQNIPMIGYLTKIDFFVIMIFVILFGCSVLHLFTLRLQSDDKISKWPVRKFYIRFLEFIGRIFVIPIITTCYLVYFHVTLLPSQIYCTCIFIGLFSLFVSVREVVALSTVFQRAMKDISKKFNELDDMSMLEVVVFNYYIYGIYSSKLTHHVRQQSVQDRLDKAMAYESELNQENTRQYDSDDEIPEKNSAVVSRAKRRPWSMGRTSLDPVGLGLGRSVDETKNPMSN
jgi:hypothetical protein